MCINMTKILREQVVKHSVEETIQQMVKQSFWWSLWICFPTLGTRDFFPHSYGGMLPLTVVCPEMHAVTKLVDLTRLRQTEWMFVFAKLVNFLGALLLESSLFTHIILSTSLAKFCQICHFHQFHYFQQIRQLFGALLLEPPLFTHIILSTGFAKFCQICHFHQFRYFRQIGQLFGALLFQSRLFTCIILSTGLAKFHQILSLLTKFPQIDKCYQIHQHHQQNFIKYAIFITACIYGQIFVLQVTQANTFGNHTWKASGTNIDLRCFCIVPTLKQYSSKYHTCP